MRIEVVDGGKPFDWGKTSADYARFRDIYPDSFYRHIIYCVSVSAGPGSVCSTFGREQVSCPKYVPVRGRSGRGRCIERQTVTAPEFAHFLKPGGSFQILYMGWLSFADRIAEKRTN